MVWYALGESQGLFCMVLGQSIRGLKRLLGGLQRSVGGFLRVLGCHVDAQVAANLQKIEKKCGSKSEAIPECFFDGFLVEDKQPWRPKFCIRA